MEIKIGDTLRVNDKWYFDVIKVADDKLSLRIKFIDNTNEEIF